MRSSLALATLAVMVAIAPASAQVGPLTDVYGRGVHAFFCYDYITAHENFTLVIDAGSEDPRAFYFRGLTYLRTGRELEAQVDFQQAASLEASDTTRFYSVSRALERIQGPERIMIEKYRAQARFNAFQERERMRFERYERIQQNEPQILLDPNAPQVPTPPTPATETSPSDAPPVPPATNAAPLDPFAPPAGLPPAGGAAPVDPFAPPAGGADPFAPPAGGVDPFGT